MNTFKILQNVYNSGNKYPTLQTIVDSLRAFFGRIDSAEGEDLEKPVKDLLLPIINESGTRVGISFDTKQSVIKLIHTILEEGFEVNLNTSMSTNATWTDVSKDADRYIQFSSRILADIYKYDTSTPSSSVIPLMTYMILGRMVSGEQGRNILAQIRALLAVLSADTTKETTIQKLRQKQLEIVQEYNETHLRKQVPDLLTAAIEGAGSGELDSRSMKLDILNTMRTLIGDSA